MEQDNTLAYRKRSQVFQKILVAIIVLAVGFWFGVSYQKHKAAASVATPAAQVNFSLFWDTWNILQEHYVDKQKLNTQAMIYGAIEGMVHSIGDPYTIFLTPKESAEFADEIKGSFGGVGIEIGVRNGAVTVIAPLKDTPASKAGIISGDVIVKIDKTPTQGMNISEAVSLIRGKKGTAVTLTIQREGKPPFDVTLVREVINIHAVDWEMVDGTTAHLHIFAFSENVDQEFKNAAAQITASKATRIILDLRDNPGGLLNSAVNIAGYFEDTNSLVTTEREGDGKETKFYSSGSASLKKYPIVILVNKGSASASEILAGALRDGRRALIIGETSYGKGSVQEIDPFSDGSALKITIAKWYTPSDLSIDQNGIKPDIEVKRPEGDVQPDKDPQLDRAREIIKRL